MKRVLLFVPVMIFALLAGVFFHMIGKDNQYMPSALVGQPLPEVKLVELYSGNLKTTDALPKGPYLINFWGTWCPACSYEHEYLMSLAENGVPIVGIDYKDEITEAKKWLSEKGNPYALVLLDEVGHFGVDMGVTGAPETFVVDSNGVVTYRHQGIVNEQVWGTLQEFMK